MKRLMLTYFSLLSLQMFCGALCYASVTDPVVNALSKVNEYAEQATTTVEDATTSAQGYIEGKMGALGDIQGASKKAEKLKKKAIWAKKQADKAKKLANDAQKVANDVKTKVDEAKKIAADVNSEVNKVKNEAEKVKKDIADAKQQVNDVKDMAQGMKELGSSALENAQAKVGVLPNQNGAEPAPTNASVTKAAEALTKQSEQLTAKATAIGGLSALTLPNEVAPINALPSQEAVDFSVEEIMSAAQQSPLVEENMEIIEPVMGLKINEVNELGTLDIKEKQALVVAKEKALEKVESAEEENSEDELDQENPNKVKIDPEAAAQLESKLQEQDAKKIMELKAFRSGRKAFASPTDIGKPRGGANE